MIRVGEVERHKRLVRVERILKDDNLGVGDSCKSECFFVFHFIGR